MFENKMKKHGKCISITTYTLILFSFLLNACGYYGSLYLPDTHSAPSNNQINNQTIKPEKPVIYKNNNA